MAGDNGKSFLRRLIYTFLGFLLILPLTSNASRYTAESDTLYRRNPGNTTPKGPYRPERAKRATFFTPGWM